MFYEGKRQLVRLVKGMYVVGKRKKVRSKKRWMIYITHSNFINFNFGKYSIFQNIRCKT